MCAKNKKKSFIDLCEWENGGSVDWRILFTDLFPFWYIFCLRINKMDHIIYLIHTWIVITNNGKHPLNMFETLMLFIYCYVHYTEAFKNWFKYPTNDNIKSLKIEERNKFKSIIAKSLYALREKNNWNKVLGLINFTIIILSASEFKLNDLNDVTLFLFNWMTMFDPNDLIKSGITRNEIEKYAILQSQKKELFEFEKTTASMFTTKIGGVSLSVFVEKNQYFIALGEPFDTFYITDVVNNSNNNNPIINIVKNCYQNYTVRDYFLSKLKTLGLWTECVIPSNLERRSNQTNEGYYRMIKHDPLPHFGIDCSSIKLNSLRVDEYLNSFVHWWPACIDRWLKELQIMDQKEKKQRKLIEDPICLNFLHPWEKELKSKFKLLIKYYRDYNRNDIVDDFNKYLISKEITCISFKFTVLHVTHLSKKQYRLPTCPEYKLYVNQWLDNRLKECKANSTESQSQSRY